MDQQLILAHVQVGRPNSPFGESNPIASWFIATRGIIDHQPDIATTKAQMFFIFTDLAKV
jgi:hypothetical protein